MERDVNMEVERDVEREVESEVRRGCAPHLPSHSMEWMYGGDGWCKWISD